MKASLKYIIPLLLLLSAAYGQTATTPTVPASVTIDSKTYYRDGYNSTDNGETPQTREAVDSVTVTSAMKYFVLPDPSVSPSYNVSTLTDLDFDDVNSIFVWELDPALTIGSFTGVPDPDNEKPLIEVSWHSTGTAILKVQETPTGPTCPSEPATVNVTVIPKPVIAFNPVNVDKYVRGDCYESLDTPAEVAFDMNVETQSAQIEVSYTVVQMADEDATPVTSNGANIKVAYNATNQKYTLTIEFTEYGIYDITLNTVTDRIARKSNVLDGVIGTEGPEGTTVGTTFRYVVKRPVRTGPIYRVPNNF